MNADYVNMSAKHVEETQENKHMNDDAKTLQEIRRRLKHAGYGDSPHIPTSVGLLIYERDAANQEVNHLKKRIEELADVDRIREIDQKDDKIEELRNELEIETKAHDEELASVLTDVFSSMHWHCALPELLTKMVKMHKRFKWDGSKFIPISAESSEIRNMTKEENDALTEFTSSELKDPIDKPVTVGMLVRAFNSINENHFAHALEKEAGL